MTILVATASDDLAALAALHKACFAKAWNTEALRDLLKTPGTLAFYNRDGFVMVRIARDEAEILTIAVAPQARRKGVATAFMERAAQAAQARGAATMFLEVATTNAAAEALYRSLGFHEVGRRKCYYGPNEDALILRAELPLIPLGNSKASIRV